MYLNEQIPMVCLGCLENKYFSLDLIFPVGWFSTKPSGSYPTGSHDVTGCLLEHDDVCIEHICM
jgi:hypothetical protein